MLTIFQGGQNKAGQFPGAGEEQQVELQMRVHTSTPRFVIIEKACTRAFSWLKAPASTFTFKALLRHYVKRFQLGEGPTLLLFGFIDTGSQHLAVSLVSRSIINVNKIMSDCGDVIMF